MKLKFIDIQPTEKGIEDKRFLNGGDSRG